MTIARTLLAISLLSLGTLQLAAPLAAQATVEDLRRDQDEILRKAERLRALMERLQTRYEREGKAEQVQLLKEGLSHLEQSGLLRGVASIRDDLTAAALTEAVRKQKQVVDDLERLLNILLERKSVENIEQQAKLAGEQAATASELERRQRLLQEEANKTLQNEPTAVERDLLSKLDELQRAERTESDRNARQAGTRRPFLEDALRRVEGLLQKQESLEKGLEEQTAGRADENRRREFDLGDLVERARELQRNLRYQATDDQLAATGKQLENDAAGTDEAALQQARERLQTQLQDAPRLPGPGNETVRDPEWQDLAKQLDGAPAGKNDAERKELQQLGARADQLGKQRSAAAAARNGDGSDKLQRDAEEVAKKLDGNDAAAANGDAAKPADKVREAAKALAEAQQAARAGNPEQAQEQVNKALGALEQARAAQVAAHPDPEKQAGSMAAEAGSTAQDLANAPSAEAAEQSANEQLRSAEQALRQTGEEIAKAKETDRKPDAAASTQKARQQLEQAKATLEEALAKANAGGAEELQAAAQRQQELQQKAGEAASQLQQASQGGQVSPEQQKAADQAMQAAAKAMQQAQQQLQSGQQSSAAQQQQAAAEQLQKAAEALQKNRPPTEEQKQALADQAEKQKALADDIVQLAKELKERDNKAAERAAQRAAEAARKAQQAMESGDSEEMQKQQEEARQNLEEAAKELEEEQDRYQDLRQEELLFKMKEELTQFLDRQKPISAQTQEAQKAAEQASLSRPARRKLNQLADEELELSGRLDFLIKGLTEEGNAVYRQVLTANRDDLQEVARRLGGRSPDPSSFTTLMQQDIERRTVAMLEALERERQHRQEQQKQQQQQQQQKSQNKFSPQQQQLVSLIADLEMLKQLGLDTKRAAEDLRTLVDLGNGDAVNEAEVAMIQRLTHRQDEITNLFRQLRARVEAATGKQEGDDQSGGQPHRPR